MKHSAVGVEPSALELPDAQSNLSLFSSLLKRGYDLFLST